jgi:two-component system NarL family sensor kinase
MRRQRPLSVVAQALVKHAVVSLLALVGIGAVAALVCIQLVQKEALRQADSDGDAIARRLVAPLMTEGVYEGDIDSQVALDHQVRDRMVDSTIQRVKVWSADGVILYCDDPRQIGLRYPLAPDDLAVLQGGGTESGVSDLSKSENRLDRGFGESLEVYAGVHDTQGRPILVETYFTATQLHSDEAALIGRIIPVILVSVLVLGLMLVPLAFGLARRIAGHERERQAMIRLAVEASSAERRRVAGELHDGVIQDLAGVGYALSAMDQQVARLGDGSAPAVGELRGHLQLVQRLVHEDVLALRELTGAQYVADTGAAGPADALRAVADDVRRGGTPVEMIVEELPPLPPAHRAALIRVGREALRNAAKHAPGSQVRLTLRTDGAVVVVTVTDDGPGFDPHSASGPLEGHLGLALLSDAAYGVGGRLDLRSRPGRGTTVRMVVPLPKRAGRRPDAMPTR